MGPGGVGRATPSFVGGGKTVAGAREVGMAITLEYRRGSVLVADDDVGLLTAASRALEDAGYQVTAVANGKDAMMAVDVANLAHKPFDVLLLDILMPGASGWEVLERCRSKRPSGTRPPRVIFMTGLTAELDLDRLRREGADGMLMKPVTPRTLVAEVRRAVLRARAGTPAAASSR